MSYILNALRKSEQERQAIQPDSITNRIIVPPPPRHRISHRLIILLIVSNLAILAYFLGFTEKTPPAVIQAIPEVKPAETARSETPPPTPPATPSPATRSPTIAEIVEARSIPAPPSTPVVKQPDVKKPPAEEKEPISAPPQPVIGKLEPAKQEIIKPTPPPIKNDLPFLDELPAEVRRSLPNLPINVFSYTSEPALRFVMIDMVKYIPGQRIKDMVELKEIREDNIVVVYDGLTFKIKRP